jgi:hypothetical protein
MKATILNIEVEAVYWLLNLVFAVALFTGVIMMIAGGLWLALIILSKAEEGIIYHLEFQRELIAFFQLRYRERRSKK